MVFIKKRCLDIEKMKNILVIAAHPDDEILGCGGTIARLNNEGYKTNTLILGEGITSRERKRDSKKNINQINSLKDQLIKANKLIGVRNVYTLDIPDNRFDTIPLLDIVKLIEGFIDKLQPDIIFTHYEKDLNIDHQITYKAVITATRPMAESSVKTIYSFEVLSSTEWNFPLSFSPDTFFDVSDTIELKKTAMSQYTSEIKYYPHPRSLDGIELNAKYWGMRMGKRYIEAFKTIRNLI